MKKRKTNCSFETKLSRENRLMYFSKNKQKWTTIVLLGLFSLNVFSQGNSIGNISRTLNGTSTVFFTNNVPNTTLANAKVINPVTGESAGATTTRIQTAISQATTTGASGVVLIKVGTYTVNEIKLVSGLRIEVEPGVTFIMANKHLFNMGRNPANPQAQISDVEITCTNHNSKFKVDMTSVANPGDAADVVRAGNVTNFAISGINVIDNFTENPTIWMVADDQITGGVSNKDFTKYPVKGVIKDIDATNTAVGYAAVQIFSGKTICIENITSTKGITVRLEPGSGKDNDELNKTTDKTIGAITNIYIDNVDNTAGFTALFLKPHAKICSNIEAKNISATNSLSALYISSAQLLPLTQRGTFTNTKINTVTFTQTITDTQKTNFSADTGLEGLRFMSDNTRTVFKDKYDNDVPKPATFFKAIPTDATGQRWQTHPLAAVMYLSKLSFGAVSADEAEKGRFSITLIGSSVTETGSAASGNKIIYRGEAQLITATGGADTTYINE